ncbi:MAG TPA: UvrD-helicase domain-containing protein, partial [Thermoanaerobaculia bacterium]|nr:UvrD-helicase domain-containing protein [Thermoanaerobaculia bacterium]
PPSRAKGRRVVAAAERLRSSALPLPALLAEAREAFDTCRDRLREWARDEFKAAEDAWIAAPDRASAAAELLALVELARRLDPELLALAHAALAPLYRQLRGELRRRGIATFQDLLAATARLFREHPEVLAQVRRATDQLLIDEVQDTDPLQYEILGRLALEGPAEDRPGLFLVGDPKQSIYGWRSADLAAYQRFVAQVAASGGPPQALQVNFRSVPAVLTEVTRLLEPVMRARDGLQPGFQRLLPDEERAAVRGFATAAPGLERRAVEHWISWPAGDGGALRTDAGSGETTELEAEWIAEDVGELHDRHGVPWRDVALLLRVLGDQDVYLDALRRRGIPFAVGRSNQYYRRREVIEAAALVRAVLDPGDHVALLTLLRSAMVGVPDAALVPLWRRGLPDALTTLDGPDPERLAALAEAVRAAAGEVPPGVPGLSRIAGWEEGLVAAVEHLARARQAFRDQPADDFVETLRRMFLTEPLEAARYLGVYRLANLERFFRRLLATLDDEPGDAAALLRALRRSVTEAQEVSEGQPQEGVEDAVRVMTIHSAKGLEFGHVYLPQAHRQAGAPPERHPTRARVAPGGDRAELLLLGQPTPGWLALEDEDARVEAAERVRLLYVAATRARDRLVVVGRWPDRPAGAPDAARSFADLLPHRAGRPADLAGLAAEARETEGAVVDDDGVLWRFPAWTRWPERSAARERPAHLPEPSAVRQEAALLAELRAEATAHQARPHSAAASEEAHHRLREAIGDRGAGEQDVGAGTRPRPGRAPEEVATDPSPAQPGRELRTAAGALDREAAMAVGTAIHRALELLEPAAEPTAELARLDAALPSWVEEALGRSAAARGEAVAEARRLLAQVAGGRLLARLRAIGSGILARELPVLLPPEAAGVVPGHPAPVGFVAGAIDLLYRDPATGELVVADYKTDAVDEAALAARAEIYRPQGTLYARAVRDALSLPRAPRAELWFLRADRVVVLGDGPGVAPAAAALAKPSPAAVPAPAARVQGNEPSADPTPSQMNLFE